MRCLDVVGATRVVESARCGDVGIGSDQRKNLAEERSDLRNSVGANTIGAVDDERRLRLLACLISTSETYIERS